MNDKPNARELLKEARLAMLRSQPDEQIETIKRIDAYLAAPSESAMETVQKIRDNDDEIGFFHLTDSDAAALIEDYAERETAALRGLVRRMREAGTWKQDSEAWFALCAEADKVLGETTP